jgi:hypothetical protein
MHTDDKQSLFDTATANLLESFSSRSPRRALLKGAVASVSAGAAMGAGSLLNLNTVQAHKKSSFLQQVFDIAVTAEQLAVTTYTNAIINAAVLGIAGNDLVYLQAALIEEQIHELFFEAAGGKPLASTFSYPNGAMTFTDLPTFIATQQQLEGIFDSAFLVLVRELGQIGQYRLAQIMAQIATIEAEHRALGRLIGNLSPADNWAFTPIFLKTILDAPAAIAAADYLSPVIGNSYTYQQVSTYQPGLVISYTTPYAVS